MAFAGFRFWPFADAFFNGFMDRKRAQRLGAVPQM
jgi:hypothetical protein